MITFRQHVRLKEKPIVISIGEFSTPADLHSYTEKIKVCSEGVFEHRIFALSESSVPYATRVKNLRRAFPSLSRSIVLDESRSSVSDIISSYKSRGYRDITVITTDDISESSIKLHRVQQIDSLALLKENKFVEFCNLLEKPSEGLKIFSELRQALNTE